MHQQPAAPHERLQPPRLHPPTRHDGVEQAYAEWVRRFVRSLAMRLPDEFSHRIHAAADHWASHHADRLGPEQAAELAALCWSPAGARSARAS